MGHLERGEKNVSFNTLVRLSEALGITLPELLSGQRKRPYKAAQKARTSASIDSLSGVIRELTHQQETLEKSAVVLKHLASALRTDERHSAKVRKR